MEPPPNSSTRSEAERLFAEYLERLERGEEADLEVLCATHPEQGDELRRLERRLSAFHAAADQSPISLFRGRGEREKAVPGPWDVAEGRVLGDYRLVERIGRGGMGEVWEAEQISLNRRVALKLLLPERVDSRGLDFFAREARAGGKLSHPGIVAVHATGEDDGLHWIAMELVEEGCDLRRSLDGFREEGELGADYYRHVAEFVAELTNALEAAHTAGVIHRDLKPGNILVTRDDRPKLTDFGLAKVMDERSLSVAGEMAGTFYYMSPEQIAAKRAGIDHRTDVFSLGVVLYEMLTLAKPFEGDTTEQVAQKILWEEPPSPLELRSKVPLDLTVICLKALEKSPVQRFQSMADLRDDLNRWLCHEPIEARPPTAIQRVAKWTRRNPVKSVASALTSVALIILSLLLADNIEQRRDLSVALEDRSVALVDRGIALEQAVEARVEADQAATVAREEAETTQEVLDFMVGLFEISDPSEARGETITAREILDRGVDQIDEGLEGEPLIKAKLQTVMGDVYRELGLYPAAEALLEEALAIRQRHLGFDDILTVEARGNLGSVYAAEGRIDEAESLIAEALNWHRSQEQVSPDLIGLLSNLGSLYAQTGQMERALPLFEETVDRSRRALGDEHARTVMAVGNLANLYRNMGRLEEAEVLLKEVLEQITQLNGEDEPDVLKVAGNLALLYSAQGRQEEAESLMLTTLAKSRRVLGDDHPDTLATMGGLASIYLEQARYAEAESLNLEVLEGQQRVLDDNHHEIFITLNELARIYQILGRFEEIETLYLESLEKTRHSLGEDHPVTVRHMNLVAYMYATQGRPDEALPLYLEVLDEQRRTLGESHIDTLGTLGSLALLYTELGRYAEGETLMLEILEKQRLTLGNDHPDTLSSLTNLAHFYLVQDRHAEAEPLMLEVLEKRRHILGDEARGTLAARNNLAALYMETGRPSEAEAYLVETLTAQRKVLGDVHPETLLSMLNLGSLYLGLNRVDEALLLARELMEHGSQSHQHYEHFKQFHEATLEQLGKAESGPSLSRLNSRAWALIDPDRTDKETDVALGLRLARAAVEAAPGDSGIRNTLAWALFANGLYDEAIAVSEKALELAPEAEKKAYQGYLDRLRSMIAEAQQQPAGAGTGD